MEMLLYLCLFALMAMLAFYVVFPFLAVLVMVLAKIINVFTGKG
jgi:hypothetical protein